MKGIGGIKYFLKIMLPICQMIAESFMKHPTNWQQLAEQMLLIQNIKNLSAPK
jgi:hypothetical protein